jgi:hypothetical protein
MNRFGPIPWSWRHRRSPKRHSRRAAERSAFEQLTSAMRASTHLPRRWHNSKGAGSVTVGMITRACHGCANHLPAWMHNVPRLMKGRDRYTLWMNPAEAARLGLADGQKVVIRSRLGTLEAPLQLTEEIREGVVSVTHGYGHGRVGTLLTVANANLVSGLTTSPII